MGVTEANQVQYSKGEVRPSSLTYIFAPDSPYVTIGHSRPGKIKLGREFKNKRYWKQVGQARFLHIRAKGLRREGRRYLNLSQLTGMP